ncbi:MAG: hypothetical protein M1274_05700 [Actinobacteria bacterium]|nr:hypothetical protein [Actinomycetota bacterium]
MTGYRHLHDQSNVAAAVLVALAEFGIESIDPSKRGQELTLHGLIQRGPYVEGRALLLAHALKYLFDRGVSWQIFHDSQRTTALRQRLEEAVPGFEFRLHEDLGSPATRAFSVASDLPNGALALFLEARPGFGRLPLHLLLAKRHEAGFLIMDSSNGQCFSYSRDELSVHLTAPVHFGPLNFASGMYLHTGIAIRLDRPEPSALLDAL